MLQTQTKRTAGMLARYLLWTMLLLPLTPFAQDSDESDRASTPEEAIKQVRTDAAGGEEDQSDAANISELTDEEAAQKAEEARRNAEETQQEADRQRQQADEAQDRADRVRGVQEKIEADAVEGPPEAADQQRRESVQSAAETAEQEAAQQSESAKQAEQEHRETSAEAEVLERAADPEKGAIYRALHDGQGRLFGLQFNATLAMDGAKYQDGTVLAGDSAFDLRRARVGLYKGFGVNWYLTLTLEVSAGQFQLRDNYVGYNGWSTLLQYGIFSEPFSQESMTSLNFITFMEEALPVAALAPGKAVGVGATKRTNTGIFNGMLSVKRPEQEGNVGEDGQAITVRYVRSPMWRPEAQNTHFGLSASYRVNATTTGTRYRTRPESNITDARLIDTGNIEGADQILRLGADMSRLWGPKSLQGEVMALQVKRTDGFEDVTFWGGYVFASWFLTGETRNYREGSGVYGATKPNAPLGGGGKGAFEVQLRYSMLDLTDKDIIGGKERNVTAGLNWLPKERWRFSANLIKVLKVDRPGSVFDDQEPWIFTIRGQYRFDF